MAMSWIGRLCTLISFCSLFGAAITSRAAPAASDSDKWCEAAIWSDVNVPAPGAKPAEHGLPAHFRFHPDELIYSLALSGGGFRAMVFHIGTLRRLNDAGMLSRLTLITSVSGGSIAAAFLAYKWPSLEFNPQGKVENFEAEIEQPLRDLARTTLDVPAALAGVLLPFTTTSNEMAQGLDQALFRTRTADRAMLSDITPGVESKTGKIPRPVFVLVATSLQTAEMWQFRARAMGGPQVGWTHSEGVALADAVAASAGFPPVFASLQLDLSSRHPETGWHECVESRDHPFGVDYRNAPGKVIPREMLRDYRRNVIFVDGGVRDNLGIAVIEETNRVRTIRSRRIQPQTATFISDAGLATGIELDPASNWWSVLRRVTDMMSDEPNDIRVANLVRTGSQTHLEANDYEPFAGKECVKGTLGEHALLEQRIIGGVDKYAYWSIRRMPKNHIGFGCPNGNSRLEDEVRFLSQVPTRLSRIPDALQARLINWGYLAAHHGIPYIPNLSFQGVFTKLLRDSCSIPFPAHATDPDGDAPSAHDVICYSN